MLDFFKKAVSLDSSMAIHSKISSILEGNSTTLVSYSGWICHLCFFSFSTVETSLTDNHFDMQLDPTINDDLHLYIWNHLLKRMEMQNHSVGDPNGFLYS